MFDGHWGFSVGFHIKNTFSSLGEPPTLLESVPHCLMWWLPEETPGEEDSLPNTIEIHM